MSRRLQAWMALVLAALASACGSAPAPATRGGPFVDPLDLPAQASPLAARGLLLGLARAGTRLVAVGQRGHVVLSDDGGGRWTQAEVPVSSDLTAVAFASPERGWAVGHDGVVLATRDGGATWARQLDGRRIGELLGARYPPGEGPPWLRRQVELLRERPGEPFLDVAFEDERNGFAVGAFNLVFRTRDGGASWTPWLDRTENPEGLHLYAIRRAGGATWVAGEQGLLLRLDPSRGSFRTVKAPYRGTLFGLAGSGEAFVVHGLRGNAFRTGDGGRTFERVETGVEDAIVGSAALPDGRLVLVSQAGQLLLGGAAAGGFRVVKTLPEPPLAAVEVAGPDEVVVAGMAGVRLVPLGAPPGSGR